MIQSAPAAAVTYPASNGIRYTMITASPSLKLLQLRLANGGYRYDGGQLEKRCSRCHDYWPADAEFFYQSKGQSDGLHIYCKACYREWKNNRTQDIKARDPK